MELKTVRLDSLQLDPNNARKHSQKNLDAITASLVKFGQQKPLVVHRGVILAGNGTLTAARSLDWQEIVISEAPDEWNEATAKAYALADNRSAELAEWDEGILTVALLELDDLGWNIENMGFEMPQVVEPEIVGTDEIFEPAIYRVASGDIWELGEHRLLCGDATLVESYSKLLGAEKVDLVWTDPPYGVSYVGGTKDALTIENDNLDKGALTNFLRSAFKAIFTSTKEGACWYVAAPSGDLFQSFSIPLSELEVWRHTLVWVKNSLVMGRADYHYRHESIFYGWTPGAAHQTPPDRKQDSVWEIDRPTSSKEHPTMKPLKLITRAINNSSLVGDLVLDPFGGSGSSLIACEETKRKSRMMELDPKYCDVILTRWEKMTGLKAELITDSENAGK